LPTDRLHAQPTRAATKQHDDAEDVEPLPDADEGARQGEHDRVGMGTTRGGPYRDSPVAAGFLEFGSCAREDWP